MEQEDLIKKHNPQANPSDPSKIRKHLQCHAFDASRVSWMITAAPPPLPNGIVANATSNIWVGRTLPFRF